MGHMGPVGFPWEWESLGQFHGNRNGTAWWAWEVMKTSTFSHLPPTGSWSSGKVKVLIDDWFIDDLAKVLQRYGITARLFADDVKVYLEITGHEDAARLQMALDVITT